jgi:hypothetical protein
MPRFAHAPLSCAVALFAFAPVSQADAQAPAYFFKAWTISRDCSEQHAGPAGHVRKGLKFRIAARSRDADSGDYALEVIDGDTVLGWPAGWSKVRLSYRAGAKMTTVPADYECVPGQESTSPFLALSDYAVTEEPWNEFEHWYGELLIHGEPHHVLIFPRDVKGPSSALVMIQDLDAGDRMQLDHNGLIHADE